MPGIAYFVHGRGRGHASRSRPVVRLLRERGYDVTVFGGGHGQILLLGLSDWRPRTPIFPGVAHLAQVPSRVVADLRDLRALAPDLVVSDGDMPSLVAARALGLPTVSVGHGLVFTVSVLPPDLPLRPLIYERANSFMATWLGDRSVAVHFLPAEPSVDTARMARPDVPTEMNSAPRDDGFVLSYFRDANGARFVHRALQLGLRVICFGDLDALPDGVQRRPFDRADFIDHLVRARGVMASAGSNVLAECVQLAKPLLALYKPNDAEQHLNAILAERAGVAMGGCFDDDPSRVVDSWLERLVAGNFKRVELTDVMPPCSEVVVETIEDLLLKTT